MVSQWYFDDRFTTKKVNKMKDIQDKEIAVGNRIAYATSYGSSPTLKKGTVVRLDDGCCFVLGHGKQREGKLIYGGRIVVLAEQDYKMYQVYNMPIHMLNVFDQLINEDKQPSLKFNDYLIQPDWVGFEMEFESTEKGKILLGQVFKNPTEKSRIKLADLLAQILKNTKRSLGTKLDIQTYSIIATKNGFRLSVNLMRPYSDSKKIKATKPGLKPK